MGRAPTYWLAMALMFTTAVVRAGAEDMMQFPSATAHLGLALRHCPATGSRHGPPVLILHGATFPSANAAAWKIEGKSWMDELAAQGYDVYALDFLGYGASDHYPEMSSEDPRGAALGDVDAMTDQVARTVDQILKTSGGSQVHLIAHSAGTFVAGRYTEQHPGRVARLVLFGAPTPPDTPISATTPEPAARYFQMSAQDQLDSFEPKVRQSGRLDTEMFKAWAQAYLQSDPASDRRNPPSVRVPNGMESAFETVSRTGRLPYDPARITVPTLVIQGEWDSVTSPQQGIWLFNQLTSPNKRFVLLSQAGHRVHLERSRFQLYREIDSFLATGDDMDSPTFAVIFEVKPKGEVGRKAYLAEAALLRPQLDAIPGFISIERFENQTRPGWLLSLSQWRDEVSLLAWRENTDHRLAQDKGRSEIFDDYRIRVVRQITAGGDLTLSTGTVTPGKVGVQTFNSLSKTGHQVALLESSNDLPGTHWQIVRDYGMFDRSAAPRR